MFTMVKPAAAKKFVVCVPVSDSDAAVEIEVRVVRLGEPDRVPEPPANPVPVAVRVTRPRRVDRSIADGDLGPDLGGGD